MGISHLLVILVIVLIIWGPSRLGGVGRGVGEAIRGFKKGLNGDDEIDVTDTSKRVATPPSAEAQHQQIREVQEDALTQAQREKDKTSGRS